VLRYNRPRLYTSNPLCWRAGQEAGRTVNTRQPAALRPRVNLEAALGRKNPARPGRGAESRPAGRRAGALFTPGGPAAVRSRPGRSGRPRPGHRTCVGGSAAVTPCGWGRLPAPDRRTAAAAGRRWRSRRRGPRRYALQATRAAVGLGRLEQDVGTDLQTGGIELLLDRLMQLAIKVW
jgi:hypothetical protein